MSKCSTWPPVTATTWLLVSKTIKKLDQRKAAMFHFLHTNQYDKIFTGMQPGSNGYKTSDMKTQSLTVNQVLKNTKTSTNIPNSLDAHYTVWHNLSSITSSIAKWKMIWICSSSNNYKQVFIVSRVISGALPANSIMHRKIYA